MYCRVVKHSYTYARKNAGNSIILLYIELIFKDVSREFDEFQVNTHLCKLRCWCTRNICIYMGDILLGGVLFFVHYYVFSMKRERTCTAYRITNESSHGKVAT